MQTISCYKPTQEEWFPNYPGNMVRVAYYNNQKEYIDDMVVVGGMDDCDISYIGKDSEYVFMRILELEQVNRNELFKLGFEYDWGRYEKEQKQIQNLKPFLMDHKFKTY